MLLLLIFSFFPAFNGLFDNVGVTLLVSGASVLLASLYLIFDLFNTLFYERVRIYKYYLVRERKFNDEGEPVFEYKEEILEDPPEKFYLIR